jgi:hypothetical protein
MEASQADGCFRLCKQDSLAEWSKFWLKAPVRKGVGSNPTAVIAKSLQRSGTPHARLCKFQRRHSPNVEAVPRARARQRALGPRLKTNAIVLGRLAEWGCSSSALST